MEAASGRGNSSIRRVAVIGAGPGGPVSGPHLALLFFQAGYLTVLEDVLPGNLRRAASDLGPAHHGLRLGGSIEDAVRDADLVIDTVPDELESKLEILTLLDRMAPPHTLFATPTEILSIADLASCTYRPAQCFGLRFPSWKPFQVAISYSPNGGLAALSKVEDVFLSMGAEVCAREDARALP